MSRADNDPEQLRSKIEDSITARLQEKEPPKEEKARLEDDHRGHLVRDTTSTLSVDPETMPPGVESKAIVPDTYCFTCGGWIGFSGINLRGTPRSKDEAYYLGGPPGEVSDLINEVHRAAKYLARKALRDHPEIDDHGQAIEFVSDELERVSFDNG